MKVGWFKSWEAAVWTKIKKQNNSKVELPAVYIIVVFFFSWLPYIIISRATYIYHFYLSVPLLCLATTYFINKYWNTRHWESRCHSPICFSCDSVYCVLPSNFRDACFHVIR